MRIAHVTQPTHAGVAAVVAALVTHQVGQGHDVTVISPAVDAIGSPLHTALALPGVVVRRWDASRSPGLSTLRETFRLRRVLRATEAHVVVLHSAKAGLAGRLALRRMAPTVFVPHAWSFEAATGLLGAFSRGWERIAQRWSSVIVCVSSDERDRGLVAGVSASLMHVIDNGVDPERFRPGSSADARAVLGLPDAPTVVCVGRLARQKGQDRLLRAWPGVRVAVPEAHLVLVGDGPDRDRLERLATEGVTLVGSQDDPRAWFHAADVVAVASRWEAAALVPLEAMASGRTVVAVNVTGVRGVLDGTGTVVTNADHDSARAELTEALVARLTDIEGTAAMGRAARRAAVASHSLGHTLAVWDDLLERMSS